MGSLEEREKFALISENLAEVLNPDLIESVLAEGRNPRVYWGNFRDLLLLHLGIMLNDRSASLRIFCPGLENRTIVGSRLRRRRVASRYPRVSRQSQSADRAG